MNVKLGRKAEKLTHFPLVFWSLSVCLSLSLFGHLVQAASTNLSQNSTPISSAIANASATESDTIECFCENPHSGRGGAPLAECGADGLVTCPRASGCFHHFVRIGIRDTVNKYCWDLENRPNTGECVVVHGQGGSSKSGTCGCFGDRCNAAISTLKTMPVFFSVHIIPVIIAICSFVRPS